MCGKGKGDYTIEWTLGEGCRGVRPETVGEGLERKDVGSREGERKRGRNVP